MGWKRFLGWLLASLLLLGHLVHAQVHVRGHYRKDGTYVAPHYRSAPDGSFSNNWSTYGNVNPYTGVAGTKVSPPQGYGADVYVQGYARQDGTHVRPHHRSAPDGNPLNNWSTSGNVNPYTGEQGQRIVRGFETQTWDGTTALRGFAAGQHSRLEQQRLEDAREMEALLRDLLERELAARSSATQTPPVKARSAPAALLPSKEAKGAPQGMKHGAVNAPPARKKTLPGKVRIGIQTGPLPPELLEVSIVPSGPGKLRFDWKELDRPVSVVASDDSCPTEVVRRYRVQ
ncbi:MAG: hypothetical protein ABL998_14550 [Planctomycetota bacterium]